MAVYPWRIALTAANRREKRNFIAGMQGRAPRRKFLIPRRNERRTKASQLGVTGAIPRKQFLDRRTVAQLGTIFRPSHNFLEPAKKKHLDAHGL